MVIRLKKQKQCSTQELDRGDCWIGLSLDSSSGLILAARVGKHTDAFIEQLVISALRYAFGLAEYPSDAVVGKTVLYDLESYNERIKRLG